VSGAYTSFISDLRSSLGAKLLTAAVAANNSDGNAGNISTATFGNFDFINLMAYDGTGSNHSTYSFAQDSINYWTGRGLPASKTVLGVPFYGRGHSNWGSTATYASILGSGGSACADSNGTYGYNGIPTIRSKASLARSYGGVMTWELSQDVTDGRSLLTAMHEAVNGQSGSYNCGGGGGGGGGSCAPVAHSSPGPCNWYTYSDCCTSAEVCASAPGCVP
jgi:GH18 family chitinase